MLRLNSRFALILLLVTTSFAFATPKQPDLSRERGRLFFSMQWPDHAQIYSTKLDGTDEVLLTPRSDTDYRPVVSPDGSTIAFTSHRDGIRAIYLMNLDGSQPRRLTWGSDAGLCAWSPDGKQLTFSSNRTGVYCIYTMNADGTQIRRLTEGPSDDFPVWSSDGRWIAYEGRLNNVWRIYRIHPDGTGMQAITTEKWDSRWPQWSPDSRQIAYTSYEQGNGDIYVMQADGQRAARQTDDPAEDRQPAWMGKDRLLFHSNRAGHFDLFMVRLNRHDERRLTHEPKDTSEVTYLLPSR
jgi:Tol biopolymer transport system component